MKSILKEILSTSVYLLVVLLITYLIVNFVGQRTEVVGSSMENTLSDGDNLIVDKITYRFRDPKRYDIIVFPFQYEKNTFYIKRIIGLPGETVEIDLDGVIYINGKELTEYYGREIIADPGIARDKITLGADEYFVMGDNRNNSTDSRSSIVGNIHKKDILGRAWLRIWPLHEFELLTDD
ncbi:MAG: signal peptidase I [Lachnospiraceae bacterium]|nr:signal peptidase I [Lachnospiraceae bacterium]